MYDRPSNYLKHLVRRLRFDKDPALAHTGDYRRLLRIHERHAALLARGFPNVSPIGEFIMRRLADFRTIRLAADCARRGGGAPGPNGLRLADLDNYETCALCRDLVTSLQDGSYRVGPNREIAIPKGTGRGKRIITIQNVEDRIVGQAARLILQPVVDPYFSPFSFGFRPERDRLDALACALALARRQRSWLWVCADVENAFDAIPQARFLDACRQHFPDDVVQFIKLISKTRGKRGIRRGSPVSPLFANIFFDWFFDRLWHRRHHDALRPLFRYADDLMMMCSTEAEAFRIREELREMARSAGTPLKRSSEVICDLNRGDAVNWLGFLLRREGTRLAIRIGERAWENLASHLAEAHFGPASPLCAIEVVEGWLQQVGPCFPFEDRKSVLQRIKNTAAAQAFDEIPDPKRFEEVWSFAHAHWRRICRRQRSSLSRRLKQVTTPSTANASPDQRRTDAASEDPWQI